MICLEIKCSTLTYERVFPCWKNSYLLPGLWNKMLCSHVSVESSFIKLQTDFYKLLFCCIHFLHKHDPCKMRQHGKACDCITWCPYLMPYMVHIVSIRMVFNGFFLLRNFSVYLSQRFCFPTWQNHIDRQGTMMILGLQFCRVLWS